MAAVVRLKEGEEGGRQLNGTLKAASGCCRAEPVAGKSKEPHKQQRRDWTLLKMWGSLHPNEGRKV